MDASGGGSAVDPDVTPLPDYEQPPVVGVTLTVQHEPIQGLRAAFLGVFAEQLEQAGHPFPTIDEDNPYPAKVEDFPPSMRAPAFEVTVLSRPMFPRVVLSNAEGFKVQVQDDRFSYGWEGNAGEYPRYPKLRAGFADLFALYATFLAGKQLKAPSVVQAEVTYRNHLPSGKGWDQHGELDQVIRSWTQLAGDGLPPIEVARLAQQHLISDEDGRAFARLHISVEPNATEDEKSIDINLTVRGMSKSSDNTGILEFFDLGRATIVRAFTSITTESMHNEWRRVK